MDSQTNSYRLFWEDACAAVQGQLAFYARKLANGNWADAEDLVQETFCRVLAYGRNPAEIENHRAYFFRTMHNVWASKWRKESQVMITSIEDVGTHALKNLPTVEPDVLLTLENREFHGALQVAKGPLSKRENQLLKLYLQGHKSCEIAKILDEDKRVISVDLNAVRAKVRYRLKKARETG